jgi:hypothetical protein
MENLKKNNFVELSETDCLNIEGGFVALIIAGIGVCFAAYAAGHMTGKAIFTK